MELRNWKLEVDADHLAWLAFDRAGSTTNTFSREALKELYPSDESFGRRSTQRPAC